MAAENIFSFYWSYSAKITCIWLSVWAIRKKADADYRLSPTARAVRWTIVAIGFIVGYYAPGDDFGPYVRVAGGFLALGFLCWPNFAYHLTNVFIRTDEQSEGNP
jgi:hypothetical protein